MIRIIYCSIICMVFLAGFVYMLYDAYTGISIIGYMPFIMCCIPLGFMLIWSARLSMAIEAYRRKA